MSPLDDVIATFQRWLYLPNPEALLAVLGTVAANRLPGDPVWLMVVGPPGGGKSEILQALNGLSDTRTVGTISERALLSGTSKKEQAADATGGVLREIGAYGILVCKDFGSLLSMQRDERQKTMAALREIYDGSWQRDVGVDGARKLHWQGKIGVLAGVTPMIDQHQAVMGAMGERFVMLRLPTDDPMSQADRALDHAGKEEQMRAELQQSVTTLFQSVHENGRRLEHDERERLKSLATLVARCRSAVVRENYKHDIILVPGAEAPTRLIVALERLLGGLRSLGIEEAVMWQIITKVGLDSMPQLRSSVLEVLFLAAGEDVETKDVAIGIRYPTDTTRRALEDLHAHHVVERGKGGSSDLWRLSVWAHKRLEQAKSVVRLRKVTPPSEPESERRSDNDTSYDSSSLKSRYLHIAPTDFSETHVKDLLTDVGTSGNGTVSADLAEAAFEGEEPE